MAGIYIHIPFCKQACYYCDFHFSTNRTIQPDLVDAIVAELHLQKDYLGGEIIKTIYFGGGTPSVLQTEELIKIMNAIRTTFPLSQHPEITLEANPDDLSAHKLKTLREAGINRLSIGIQSFDEDVLTFLNRAHTAQSAMTCMEEARQAGFNNISIDLIYAIPGQSLKAWQHNLHQSLAFSPEHLSAYSLTLEEKTVFGRWSAHGKLRPVDDDEAANQLEILIDTLEHAGYDHYEVSNFGKPGFWSQHNTSYWRQEKYLGVGPSAHSYNGESRQYNISNNHLYIRALKESSLPFEMETLTRENKINDYLLTTLRTSWGTNLDKLKNEYSFDLIAEHHDYVDRLITQHLACLEHQNLRLTRKGRLLADKITSDLFAPAP